MTADHEDQVQQLKSYIKCLESDLQDARVQMVMQQQRSISPHPVDVGDDVLNGNSDQVDSVTAADLETELAPAIPATASTTSHELQDQLNQSLAERDLLEDQVKSMREELENFRCQTKITSTCAIIPLIMLVIAILIAFYPTVSTVTGTTE